MMRASRFSLTLILAVSILSAPVFAAERTEVNFPDINGYQTLKCDFHMHTVFSDGSVWPTVRVHEAWRNGLDAIAITDHVEYQPKKADVQVNQNRSYEIAKPEAAKHHMILIRGTEITRQAPHGHFNAIYIKDAVALNQKNNEECIKRANEQGGFVFFNHPGNLWTEVQDGYLEKRWMHGIEVINGHTYYETSHTWCLEHGLTMIGTTDIHSPIDDGYDFAGGGQRSMTLVFAKERSADAIHEALRDRRTVVYGLNMLIGEKQWVEPLFHGSVTVQHPEVTVAPLQTAYVGIHNASSVTYELEAKDGTGLVSIPGSLTLPAGKTIMMHVKGHRGAEPQTKQVSLPYTVTNVLTAPGQGLDVAFDLTVTIAEG